MVRIARLCVMLFLLSSSSFQALFGVVDYKKRMGLGKNFHYYKVMGDRFRNMREFSMAIKNYEYALALNPDCAECYLFLGKIKYQKNIYVEAIKELHMAIEKPFQYAYDRMRSFYLLATIYFKINREGKAIEILKNITREYEILKDRAVEARLIEPSHYAPAFFLIGLYYRNNGFLDQEKLSYFIKSMQLNYKKDFCNYFIYEYYNGKSPDEAYRYLNQAMTVNPNIQADLQKATWLKDYSLYEELEE